MLVTRRDKLVEQLPRELAVARGLTADQAELVVDESIDYIVTQFPKPLRDVDGVERAFWAAASLRARRIHEGRGSTVRAGWKRVDIDRFDVPCTDGNPEQLVVEHSEREALLEFAATLTDRERQVLAAKYGGQRELGRVQIARRLELPIGEVRKAERSLQRKLERFVTIMAAGSLCSHRQPLFTGLVEGELAPALERLARLHLAHCPACQLDYAARLRALKSGKLPRDIAGLLPVPPIEEVSQNPRGLWETITDWASRPFAHDAVSTGTQLGTAGRGLGTIAAAKLAALCLVGVTAVGGGLYCLTGPGSPPAHHRQHRRGGGHRPSHAKPASRSGEPRHAVVVQMPAATSTPRKLARPATTPAQRRAIVPTSTRAISPAPAGSVPNGASEFGPTVARSSTQPAAPAAGGGPEFP